jgi:ferredoxin
VENTARWFDVEEGRPNQMLQAENICVEEEARLEVEAARAREEEIRRKEEERKQWEEFHEVQGRSSYPIASGGFGDIWKCVLVKPSSAIQVCTACGICYHIILTVT